MSAAPISLDIARESPLWDRVPEADAIITRAVETAVTHAGLAHADSAELSVVLTDDAGIRVINAQWRGQDKPTNVLSFPQAEPQDVARAPLLGDIILAFETLEREADSAGIGLADHLTHLSIHGLLHLFGYDHVDDSEAETMEAMEVAILARLGIANPYADTPGTHPIG